MEFDDRCADGMGSFDLDGLCADEKGNLNTDIFEGGDGGRYALALTSDFQATFGGDLFTGFWD
jgi:hypothetical protein